MASQDEFDKFFAMLLEIRKLPPGHDYSIDFNTFKAYLTKAFMSGKVTGLHDGHRDVSTPIDDARLKDRLEAAFKRIISY